LLHARGQRGGRPVDPSADAEDRLRPGVIDLQAERWERTVGRADIQQSAGALGRRPRRCGGILIPMDFSRITVDARQLGGVPCIRGLRIPVATVVGMVADGMTTPEILEAYPDLDGEDVREALRFAADAVRERELPLASER